MEELAFGGFLLREVQRVTAKAMPGYAALMVGLTHSFSRFWHLAQCLARRQYCWKPSLYGAVYLYRGKLYDAVLAHAVTNLLLAFYAMAFEHWSYL